MSVLRARCPRCDTLTAVALGNGYQCHACGEEFAAGLVRVPRAWGAGGDAMADAAALRLPYPEAAVVTESSLEAQSDVLARSLPRPALVLGGCCCAHLGAIRGLATRHGRLAVVWLDAHGDLNTPATSPSGNAWGMPLRSVIDEGLVRVEDLALWGVRSLDPPEAEFIEARGISADPVRALEGVDAVYVALDVDVLAPGEIECFMPEPGGPGTPEVEGVLQQVVASGTPLAGMGVTGLRSGASPARVVALVTAAGL